ncbi:MAG: hypothetical protein U5L45_12610 [Saprospiraceae bacterium]|nr:hypothetical protein [Saprospiraceae bacterium]
MRQVSCIFVCHKTLTQCTIFVNKYADLCCDTYKTTLHYDVESTVTRQVVDEADASKMIEYDKIAAIPFVHRVEVQMGIKADGTSDWVITKKEPNNPLKTVSNAPADPTPKTVTLKVKDNKLTTYDKAGKLLTTKDFDANSLTKRYLELLNPDNSLNQVSLRGAMDVRTIIAEARSQGATVETTDSIHYCIKKRIPNEPQYSITYLDASIGKVVGMSLNKSNGQFIYSNNVVFTKNSSNDYVLSKSVERSFGTSPSSGVAIVTEKLNRFNSFSTSVVTGGLGIGCLFSGAGWGAAIPLFNMSYQFYDGWAWLQQSESQFNNLIGAFGSFNEMQTLDVFDCYGQRGSLESQYQSGQISMNQFFMRVNALYSNPACTRQVTTLVQVPLNGKSDGVVPLESQRLQGATNFVLEGVNHFELRDHPIMTDQYNKLFSGLLDFKGNLAAQQFFVTL